MEKYYFSADRSIAILIGQSSDPLDRSIIRKQFESELGFPLQCVEYQHHWWLIAYDCFLERPDGFRLVTGTDVRSYVDPIRR